MQLFTKISLFYDNLTNFLSLFTDPNLELIYKQVKYKDFIGKTTLITGESGSGKTEFTTGFILYIIDKINSKSPIISEKSNNFIFILDMAPISFKKNNSWIGGKLTNFIEFNFSSKNFTIYDYDDIIPPRSSAKDKIDVEDHVAHNINQIEPSMDYVFEEIKNLIETHDKSEIYLVINDLSIYLHGNEPDRFINLIDLQRKSKRITIFLNAYEGTKLLNDFGSNISKIEKERVDYLKNYSDYAIKLL